jgi:hypothetical protein
MEIECEANDERAAKFRSDQTSKVRKAGSALDHELGRAGRTRLLGPLNMRDRPGFYKKKFSRRPNRVTNFQRFPMFLAVFCREYRVSQPDVPANRADFTTTALYLPSSDTK